MEKNSRHCDGENDDDDGGKKTMELHTKMELKQKKSFSPSLAHPKSLNNFTVQETK